ncbi:hypothetical protein BP5796_06566 [Coleophoma crateriformis]|uniref:Zn(2)-C6 fungal-type domain-containing protein n=1 Tax=Coleophoma crateriformis TaxID=565419 RepID=A0A3D8RP10_9HELO|nr:hypothetical protein BP5796_06566 [Coleophoma crateriformis]
MATGTSKDAAAGDPVAQAASAEASDSRNRPAKRPASRGSASYPRKRANKACQVCRARRTKCDNQRPACGFCEKTGAICTWLPNDLSSFDPASLAILERFDQLESLLLSTVQQNPARSLEQTLVTPHSNAAVTYQDEISEDQLGCVDNELVNVRLEEVLQWDPLQTQLSSFVCPPETHQDHSVRFSNGQEYSSEELDLVSCDEMLMCFWKSVHSKNPILVQEDLRQRMSNVCMNGIRWDAESCLVLLVCALGTISSDFGENTEDEEQLLAREEETHRLAKAEHYFSAAQKRIGVCLGKRGLLEAQCFFYAGVYLATTMRLEAAWSLFLQAKVACQDFRCLSRIDSPTEVLESNSEVQDSLLAEECTYWTCLKSELELHHDISAPGFRSIDLWYPERFPAPPRNNMIDNDRPWFFYLAEIALRRLANRIMGHVARNYDLNNPQDLSRAREATAAFEHEAQDWVTSLPNPNGLNNISSDVLNFILKGHLANCYELMYWPFLGHALNAPSTQTLSDPENVVKSLKLCVDRIEINQPGFRHRHHGTYGMVRSCARSAFVLLAAHWKGGLFREIMPENWQRSVWSVIQLLEFWKLEIKGANKWKEMMVYLLQEEQKGQSY